MNSMNKHGSFGRHSEPGANESSSPQHSASSPYSSWNKSHQQTDNFWGSGDASKPHSANEETLQFDRPGANAQRPPQSAQTAQTQDQHIAPVHAHEADPVQKPKRTIGLVPALALMLVGSISTGVITGVVTSSNSTSSNQPATSVSENLSQPVSNNAQPAAEGSVEQVADKVVPTVVSIRVADQRQVADGSGSIISSDGYVLTNHHVVANGQNGQIQVTMSDGTRHAADFVASDAATDIAVIKIRDAHDLPTIGFGDSDDIRVGQEIVAIGSPLGLSSTVTSGIVSAVDRPVRASQQGGESSLIDGIQTDAAINPGNSGGPLVDMNGNLIGMNSMIASLSAGKDQAGSIGLGFAIPSNFVMRVARQLIETGEARHPLLGVQVDARNPVNGALVLGVEPGSPADQAGLQVGDVVTRLNDRQVDDSDTLIAATRSHEFGETVTLEVISEGADKPKEVEVTLSN